MVRCSFQHTRLAGTADALAAGVVGGDAGLEERIQNGFSRFHCDGAVASGQPYLEAPLERRSVPGPEILDVDAILGTVGCGGLERLQHRRGATAVQMSLR